MSNSGMAEIAMLENRSPTTAKSAAKWAFGLAGACALGITAAAIPFLSPALRKHCLPYIPATDAQVSNVLQALRWCSGAKPNVRRVIDLGSGDGRIVLAAAKEKYLASGVEINKFLVLFSRLQAFKQKLRSNTKFFVKDMWKTDLSTYDAVIIFGTENLMTDLSKKLASELKSDSFVVACRFSIDHWRSVGEIGSGIDKVWIYSVPQSCYVHQSEIEQTNNEGSL